MEGVAPGAQRSWVDRAGTAWVRPPQCAIRKRIPSSDDVDLARDRRIMCRLLETMLTVTPELGIAIGCGGVLTVGFVGLCKSHPSCNPRLLENGIPCRAVVVDVENQSLDVYNRPSEDLLKFSYRYETTGGIYRFGYFSLTRRRSWQLAITRGTTFTVLYLADDSEEAMPYFLITGQEIVGAIGAKISPA